MEATIDNGIAQGERVQTLAPGFYIHPKLAGLMPPSTAREYEELYRSITREGVREPLSIAEIAGMYYLLDGHTRLRIARELSVPYETRVIELPDGSPKRQLREAQSWMIDTAMSRRNLCLFDQIALAYTRFRALYREGRPEPNDSEGARGLDSPAGRARAHVAKETGASEKTCQRALLVIDAAAGRGKYAKHQEYAKLLTEGVRHPEHPMTISNAAKKVQEGPDPEPEDSKAPYQIREEHAARRLVEYVDKEVSPRGVAQRFEQLVKKPVETEHPDPDKKDYPAPGDNGALVRGETYELALQRARARREELAHERAAEVVAWLDELRGAIPK